MGTCYWEPVLWEPCLETVLGSLFLGTCSSFLGILLGNLFLEPNRNGNFGHADLGCSDLRQAVYYGFRPHVWEKQLFEATRSSPDPVPIRFWSGSDLVPMRLWSCSETIRLAYRTPPLEWKAVHLIRHRFFHHMTCHNIHIPEPAL